MAHYIITGNYTAQAIKGMVASPSDREAAVRSLVEASGGKLKTYLATTGESDFLMIAESETTQSMMSALMVAGATGSVSNLKTVLGFTSAEFLAAQKEAGRIASSFKPAG